MLSVRFSALNAPDRLFISSSAVAMEAEVGILPDASPTLTLGVEYSLVSVVYLIWGSAHYVTQFRLKEEKWLKYDCTGGGGTTSIAIARLPRLIDNDIPGGRSCTHTSRRFK